STDGTTWTNIASNGTGATYTLTETDENQFVRVQEVFTNDTGQSVTLDSAATATKVSSADTTPPVWADTINVNGGLFEFTGVKTNPGNIWTFQASVTDDDQTFIGQGGIVKFTLSDNGVTIGTATFDSGSQTWTGTGLIASVSYANGVYT